MFATRLARFAQIQEHSRRAVYAVAGIERRADQLQQSRIVSRSLTLRLLQPGVVAARRDLEYSAHKPDVESVAVEPHELINLPCSSRTEFRDHRRSPAPLLAQELRVHEMLGSPNRPKPAGGHPEVIATKAAVHGLR